MSNTIPFNKVYITGKESVYISDVMERGKISGNGHYTSLCTAFLEKRYGYKKTFLTSSCTDALEMIALLLDIQPGDEVITPSFTFVSTVNAFVLRGAKIIFADSEPHHPNIYTASLQELITPQTKAIIAVHYAGMGCDMETLSNICSENNIVLVEDAAQAIDASYNGQALGSFGQLAAISFHDTKNIVAGEGGALIINDEKYISRAEILWEKGTNRNAFIRGEVDKYGWVDIGSSFLASELAAAFLYAQLETIDAIQQKRKTIWNKYFESLQILQNRGCIELPVIPEGSQHNAHIFYFICADIHERAELMRYLQKQHIQTAFHYQALHISSFYTKDHPVVSLPNSEKYSDRLLRLPLYPELSDYEQTAITESITQFYIDRVTKPEKVR